MTMKLNEDELRTFLLLIRGFISDNVIQNLVEYNTSEDFQNNIEPLIYRILDEKTINTRDVSMLYEKLSNEYLDLIRGNGDNNE
jgi:hypothetical protein